MTVSFGSKRAVKTVDNCWMSLEEASIFTGYSVKSIRRAVWSRELAVSRNGDRGRIKISMSELTRWMKSKEIPASRVALGK